MCTWGILYAGGQKLKLFKRPIKSKTHYSALWNNSLFGLVAAQAMVTLADSRIFASNNKLDQLLNEQIQTSYLGLEDNKRNQEEVIYH